MSRPLLVDLSRREFMAATAGLISLAPAAQAQRPLDGFEQRFREPPARQRPKVRWWLPSASVDDAVLREQIGALAEAGIGSAEIANMSGEGWGTPEWRSHVAAAMKGASRRGLQIDLTVGPRWPAAVPGIALDGPEAAKVLLHGRALLRGGETFSGPLPRPERPKAVSIAPPGPPQPGAPPPIEDPGRDLPLHLVAVNAVRLASSDALERRPVMLDRGSAIDLTDSLAGEVLTWTAPAAGTWALLAFWRRGSGKTADGRSPVICHFSAAGAAALTRFWDTHLVDAAVAEGLRTSGGNWFEDSVELGQHTHWTPDLVAEIRNRRGFDIRPHLAVLLLDYVRIFNIQPVYDYADRAGQRIRNDYFQTLTELYQEHHLLALKAWANAHGLRMRQQPAYGVTVNMAATAVSPDIPETESLFFAEKVDAYRTMAGAAHIAGKPVFSIESGCVIPPGVGDDAYAVTAPAYLKLAHGHFAAGVNQIVLHGFPYPTAAGAAWPGYAPFESVAGGLAEAWGPRNPEWRHMRQLADYLARLQVAMQEGVPVVDVAVFRHAYWERGRDNWDLPNGLLWNDGGMAGAGYTYEYVDPSHLLHPGAVVEAGRLYPSGPGYRALILTDVPEPGFSEALRPASNALTLRTARKLLDLARSGLPILIIGGPPTQTPFYSDAMDDERVAETVRQLLQHPRVVRVGSEADVPAALKGLGVRPEVEYSTRTDNLFNAQRKTSRGRLIYLYNQGSESTAEGYRSDPAELTLSVAGEGRPTLLDAWSGAAHQIQGASLEAGRSSFRLSLPASGACLVEILAGEAPARSIPRREKRTISLERWSLRVDDWTPGGAANDTVHTARAFDVAELRPWTQIDGLGDVSGIGRYTAKFHLPAFWLDTSGRARLRLGQINGTAKVEINGHSPAVNLAEFTADCTGLLRAGTNTIVVEVATALNNRLRALPGGGGRAEQLTGLLGPVVLELLS